MRGTTSGLRYRSSVRKTETLFQPLLSAISDASSCRQVSLDARIPALVAAGIGLLVFLANRSAFFPMKYPDGDWEARVRALARMTSGCARVCMAGSNPRRRPVA